MCDINAYYYENGKEELLMESVDKVIPDSTRVCLENMYGQRVIVKGRVKELSLYDHRIIIERCLIKEEKLNSAADPENVDRPEPVLRPVVGG